MKTKRILVFAALFLSLSCEKDKFDLRECDDDNCIKASGYIYNRLTSEPLNSAIIQINYKENCWLCATGCLFRDFSIGTVTTNEDGYFQTDFSTRDFKGIIGTYVFYIRYDDFIDETFEISNENQSEFYIETQLNPPAYLNLSINLHGTEDIEYFGLDIYPDSLTARSIGGYNSNESGLFSDTTIIFKVPAERMIYYGYLINTSKGKKYSNDSTFIARYETKYSQINE